MEAINTKKGLKRNLEEHDQEIEDDDEKIEEFFAIIRRFKNARDRDTNSLRNREEADPLAPKKAKVVQSLGWVPSFEWGDFAEQDLMHTSLCKSELCLRREEEKKKEEWKGFDLDLKLGRCDVDISKM
ncbi:hypothetical protein Pfo_005120 [Paulownia fortunei]|nr:hypothetical protein Pfo_005120 [Paulownia fortunei]